VLRGARARGDRTRVLVLTARNRTDERIAGLNAGADDYLAKPFDLEELEARIHAQLRRKGNGEESMQKCGRLRFERSSGAFYNGEEPLEFTPREQALLKALIARPGHAVNRERLLQVVFPEDANVQVEAIEVVIHRLRKKLMATETEIMTLRGVGYLLRPQTVRHA
jgi:two-component system response regulator TctD